MNLRPIIITLLLITVESFALNPATVISATSSAMGGTLAARKDDVSLMIENPCSIVSLDGVEFRAAYQVICPGLELNLYDGSIDRLEYYQIAIGSTLGITRSVGFACQGFQSTFYEEGKVAFAFADSLTEWIFYGCSAKLIWQSVATTDYSIVRDRDTVFCHTFDIGLMMQRGDFILGGVWQNINSPRIGFFQPEELRGVLRFGFARRGETSLQLVDLTLGRGAIRFGIGSEHLIAGDFSLRYGISDRNVGCGFGYLFRFGSHSAGIDYSFVYPLSELEGTYGDHLISIGLSFWER